jgi:hypothetical protein
MASSNHETRRTDHGRAWRACVVGLAVACTLGSGLRSHAESLTSAAYRIDLANNLVWYDNQGQPIVQATASRLSSSSRRRFGTGVWGRRGVCRGRMCNMYLNAKA